MTEVRLSTALDVKALAAAFTDRRRLHIPAVLTPEAADAVADTLEAETRWKTTVAAGGDFFELPLEGRAAARRNGVLSFACSTVSHHTGR